MLELAENFPKGENKKSKETLEALEPGNQALLIYFCLSYLKFTFAVEIQNSLLGLKGKRKIQHRKYFLPQAFKTPQG